MPSAQCGKSRYLRALKAGWRVAPACGENCLKLVGSTAASAAWIPRKLCCYHNLAAAVVQDAVMLSALELLSWGMLGASYLSTVKLSQKCVSYSSCVAVSRMLSLLCCLLHP